MHAGAWRCALAKESQTLFSLPFELADEYGERVPDGSTRTLTVTAGDVTKTVRVRFLMIGRRMSRRSATSRAAHCD